MEDAVECLFTASQILFEKDVMIHFYLTEMMVYLFPPNTYAGEIAKHCKFEQLLGISGPQFAYLRGNGLYVFSSSRIPLKDEIFMARETVSR